MYSHLRSYCSGSISDLLIAIAKEFVSNSEWK